MGSSLFLSAGSIALAMPFLIAAALLLHCFFRHSWRKRNKTHPRSNPAFCTSSAALGTILLFVQVFYRPSIAYVVEARQEAGVEEDDAGDPDTPARQLERQLRRIRRGEPVDRLVLRV